MTEEEFLKKYDPALYPNAAVTVDLVLMSVIDKRLAALLVRREEHPALGKWALPGGFVGPDEGMAETALRVLRSKVGFSQKASSKIWLEQLYSFGAPKRDPRMRIITVAYQALLPAARFRQIKLPNDGQILAELTIPFTGTDGEVVGACNAQGKPLACAFDHAFILGHAVKRLRGKIDYSAAAFALLPDRFTLRALQDVHEAVLGIQFGKPAFRRRMLDTGCIEGTGIRETDGAAFRPAELFQLKSQS